MEVVIIVVGVYTSTWRISAATFEKRNDYPEQLDETMDQSHSAWVSVRGTAVSKCIEYVGEELASVNGAFRIKPIIFGCN